MSVESSNGKQLIPFGKYRGQPLEVFRLKKDGSHDNGQSVRLTIEIKPSVGDDFPSVMRQMKKAGSNILFVRNYSGSGVSEEIFVEMFESQKIFVIFEREISL